MADKFSWNFYTFRGSPYYCWDRLRAYKNKRNNFFLDGKEISMILVFTLGSTKSYNEAIINNPNTRKIGKYDDYDGGWVWQNRKATEEFLNSVAFRHVDWGDGKPRNPENFSVYGVLINDWSADTYQSQKDQQHHLLVDAQLIMLK